ncbi:hypothetical protein ACFS5J_04130 [Flavobacterium chuncheonense]|uniref:Uncharacterized protein n=1 Tax=Flavobacterium chuncheonense TaxID=2026653 RepID=A0ABW5YJL7_9FLAO
MKMIFLEDKIRKYFFSENLKSPSDIIYKEILECIRNLKTKEELSGDLISRKKTVILNHFSSFFNFKSVESQKIEIEKALKVINEIIEN